MNQSRLKILLTVIAALLSVALSNARNVAEENYAFEFPRNKVAKDFLDRGYEVALDSMRHIDLTNDNTPHTKESYKKAVDNANTIVDALAAYYDANKLGGDTDTYHKAVAAAGNLTDILEQEAYTTIESGYYAAIESGLETALFYWLAGQWNNRVGEDAVYTFMETRFLPYIAYLKVYSNSSTGLEYCGGTFMTVAQLMMEASLMKEAGYLLAMSLGLEADCHEAIDLKAAQQKLCDTLSEVYRVSMAMAPDYKDSETIGLLASDYINTLKQQEPLAAEKTAEWVEACKSVYSQVNTSKAAAMLACFLVKVNNLFKSRES